ncbi:MAG: 3H domain-containing protein [Christensenellales bacterium]|jgi:transcriptional regulator of NAD metabolism
MRKPEERRELILQTLSSADAARVTAQELAAQLGVSRQIIVSDIAILRERGIDIMATSRGYSLGARREFGYVDRISCRHDTEEILREFDIIVDNGGCVLDISIAHPVYGIITAALYIRSRRDARAFVEQMHKTRGKPLSMLTGGAHLHTVGCSSREEFEAIIAALADAGLYEETD